MKSAKIIFGLLVMLDLHKYAFAEGGPSGYPAPKTFEQYRISDSADEIVLARSAAPASISKDAEILTLGKVGYETAVKGSNHFVCLVERSWGAPFENAEFWNPKIRSPICLNPPAVSSVLPIYLERTRWVLSGMSTSDMMSRTQEAVAKNVIRGPQPVSMSYMMSKQGYVSDAGTFPHVMFFLPPTEAAAWGANLPAVPVFSQDDDTPPSTLFFVVVPKWSDGSPFPEKH